MSSVDSPGAPTCDTIVDLLLWRSKEQPHNPAFTFLTDGETRTERWDYAELDRRAREVAVCLQSLGAVKERVLLLFPSGLEFIAAFFGCLYANAIAVPAYPPRPNRGVEHLNAIIADCSARFVLTSSSTFARIMKSPDANLLQGLHWLLYEEIVACGSKIDDWETAIPRSSELAFLQYTSGSTARPKGVRVTHENLWANSSVIYEAFRHDGRSKGVGWLPLFHDMGLIGNVLQPLYSGAECILMSPESFLMKPLRWLQAISRYGAHSSGGPNFAYELCIRKISHDVATKSNLDLNCWQVAFTGAEPVRASTIERFSAAFAPFGFRREAWYPCYGLAEATLFVSGGPIKALSTPQELHDPSQSHTVVSCGKNWGAGEIVIANHETKTRCKAGEIGEIWIKGPHVADGYWGLPIETTRTFDGHLESGEGPFLRTGDLGYWRDSELFVTGRLKDLIIVGGRNHYAEDIEQSVKSSHPFVCPNGCAAFSVDILGEEKLVVFAELEQQQRHISEEEKSLVLTAIRQAIALQHDLRAYQIALLLPGRLPKTSSGKVQRNQCRQKFMAGEIETLKVL